MWAYSVLFALLTVVSGLLLDINDKDSICAAGKLIANGELNYYEGLKKGGTVGMFTPPNYWWNAGEAFGGLLDFYTFCEPGNDTLKEIIYNGMYHQAGDQYNYIPSNQSLTEGNDDQGVWGMAIMGAVERNFTNPPEHSWLSMAQAIYNTMNLRWDAQHCGGGLRWQIFTWNSGYDYKNSISNGCLFHISARLALFLDNETYAKTAEKVWDWMESIFFQEEDGQLTIYDGASIENNCSNPSTLKWSYTYGIFMAGAAYMYNYTHDDVWKTRAQEILEVSSYFFDNKIMQESTCQRGGQTKCNNDQISFRSLFSRCLLLTSVLIPETYDQIREYIEASAQGAAQSCSGGSDGVSCGQDWTSGKWDGTYGLGQQQCALEVTMALLAKEVKPPLTRKTGGTSKSDPNSGINTQDQVNQNELKITGKDKAGAGILTAVVLAIITGGAAWMLF